MLHLGDLEGGAELRPAVLRQPADDDVAVGRLEDAPDRRQVLVAASGSLERAVGDEVLDLPGLHRDLAAEQRRIDLLSLAGPLAHVERADHGGRQVERAHVVGDRGAGGQREAVGLAGRAEDAALRLRGQVERRVRGARPLGSVAGGVAVDDLLVLGAHLVVAQPQALHDAGPEVVDHDVRFGGQLEADVDRLAVLQVERDAALAAVVGEEVGAEALLADGADDPPKVAEVRRFDLHHVGAHVGEDERCLWPLLEDREIEDADAV